MNNITTNREFFSEFLAKQTRVGGIWEAAAPLPGGRGLPPHCRAAWGAGRPAVGRPVLQRLVCKKIWSSRGFFAKKFVKFLQKSPFRPAAGRPGPGLPAAGRPGYIPVNFENENIFL